MVTTTVASTAKRVFMAMVAILPARATTITIMVLMTSKVAVAWPNKIKLTHNFSFWLLCQILNAKLPLQFMHAIKK